MNPNPKKNFDLIKPLFYGLFFLAGFAVAYFFFRPVSDEFPKWDQSECREIPNNARDGFRIGNDGPLSPADTPTAKDLMDNYYNYFHRPLTTAEVNSANITETVENTGNQEGTFIKGGNISRCVLLDILKSLEDQDRFVNYAFGRYQDKTILLIQGGIINPITNERMEAPLLFRTGTDVNCFCPNQCGIQ